MLLLVLLAATPAVAASVAGDAAPRAVATASKPDVSVGETFTIEVKATGPAGSSFQFPPAAAQETFELRDAPPDSTPLPAGSHRYLARVFAVGDAEVPPIPVRYRLSDGTSGEVQTAALPLHVVSLLPKEKAEQKLVDVHPPVPVPVGALFWAGLSIAVALFGALLWWVLARRRKVAPQAAASQPALEPHEEALRALDTLVASGRLGRAEYRLFYIELTLIAKRYLERRLEAPIVEMTTVEMLAFLRASPRAAELASTLRDLSGAADQIKFARGSGLADEAERHLGATRSLVASLEARFKPVESPQPQPQPGGQAA